MRGSNADLRDVGAPIDNVADEVADRETGCVDGNPGVSGRNETLELGDRRRLVSGDLGHADRGECQARVALDLAQSLELIEARPSNPVHGPPT
jgi:hypothetical protein